MAPDRAGHDRVAPVREALGALLAEISDRAAETESARRVAPDLVGRMAEAGCFRLALPAELGGVEAHPADLLEIIEALAAADGSAGWVAMIGSVTAVFGAYLPDAAAEEIYGDDQVVTGGVFAPMGRAERDGEGWRVNGRWPFASGSQHCRWLLGGCVAGEELIGVMLDAADVEIVDTWNVSGLRGTGSHDMAVTDAWVPAERALPLLALSPVRGGPLYRFPLFGLLALGIGAVSLGLARRSVDELTALTSGGGRRAARRSSVQAAVAETEARLTAVRAGVLHEIDRAWEEAAAGGDVAVDTRARLRASLVLAARTAADVTRTMYDVGGGASLYDSSPLQRCFRDAHAATQHIMVGTPVYELAGRVLLGVDTDTSQL